MPKMKKVRANEHPDNTSLIIIEFDNDRSHAVYINDDSSPKEVSDRLMALGNAIRNDPELNQ